MRGRTTLILLLLFVGLAIYAWRFEWGKPSQEEQAAEALILIDLGDIPVTHGVRIETRVDTLELQRGREGEWHMIAPATDRADDNAVRSLLQQLHPLRATELVDPSPGRQITYRLDRPEVVARFRQPRTSGVKVRTLTIGRKNIQFDGYYARVDDDTTRVGIVPSWFVESFLQRDPSTFRNRRLTHVGLEDVDRLGLETDEGRVLLSRNDTRRWEIVQPVVIRADQAAVNGLLRRYVTQTISRFVDEHPRDVASYGLDDPVVTMQIVLANDAATVFQVGDPADELGEEVFARISGRAPVFTIPTTSLAEFEKTLYDLRDRRLLVMSPGEVRRFSATSSDGTLEAERDSVSGRWFAVDPDGARTTLRALTIDQALQNLSVLEGTEFFDGPLAAGGKGFTSPILTVAVFIEDGPKQSLQFARTDGGSYARVLPDGVVARVTEGDAQLFRGLVRTPPLDPGGDRR